MAVDAAMVNQAIGSPYAMFVLFVGIGDKKGSVSVAAKDIVMVYKGQEIHMPSLSDLRKNYGGGIRDLDFYARLGKEGIISSWVKFYDFPDSDNFFPPLALSSNLALTEGHMTALPRLHDPPLFQESRLCQGGQADDQGQGREEPRRHRRVRGRARLTAGASFSASMSPAADATGLRQAPSEQT